jgi:hypothetical protein
MDAVIFIGLQGAGKTTFYQQRFARSHQRISLDQLKTRPRELHSVQAAIAHKQEFVIDNTNPTIAERARYIALGAAAGYRIVGYYFEPDIQACLKRNALRSGKEKISIPGLFGTRKRMQPPSFAEGFDVLYIVRVNSTGSFVTEPLTDAAPATDPAKP